MADRSKVVYTERDNKHRSRLVKAFQDIENVKDTSIATRNSRAVIKSGGVTIDSSNLDFEFTVPFDDNLEANEGEVTIYNLSNTTLAKFNADSRIIIEAGYSSDTGVIFDGYITKKSTVRDGADRVTTLKIIDDIRNATKDHYKGNYNRTYHNSSASHILRVMLVGNLKTPLAKFKTERDYKYEEVTIDEPLESAIKKFAEVCGVSVFTACGKVYCCNLEDAGVGSFDISEHTGMIGSPLPYEETSTSEEYNDIIEGYDVDMLLQHRMLPGAKINLKSEQYSGTFYVKSGQHTFNNSEAKTNIKAVRPYKGASIINSAARKESSKANMVK